MLGPSVKLGVSNQFFMLYRLTCRYFAYRLKEDDHRCANNSSVITARAQGLFRLQQLIGSYSILVYPARHLVVLS